MQGDLMALNPEGFHPRTSTNPTISRIEAAIVFVKTPVFFHKNDDLTTFRTQRALPYAPAWNWRPRVQRLKEMELPDD